MNITLLASFGLACFLIWAHGYWMGWRDRDARRPVSTLLLTDELRNWPAYGGGADPFSEDHVALLMNDAADTIAALEDDLAHFWRRAFDRPQTRAARPHTRRPMSIRRNPPPIIEDYYRSAGALQRIADGGRPVPSGPAAVRNASQVGGRHV
jgi:hypothetical protein